MYDSAASSWPSDAQYILAYIDGPYANVAAAQAHGAWVVTITTQPDFDVNADCCDIEPGCLSPLQGAAFAKARQEAGLPATQYFSVSNLGEVVAANAQLGVSDQGLYFFGADYDGVAEVPAGYIAKQYETMPGIYGYDTSICLSTWPALPQPKPPVPKENELMFVRNPGPGNASGPGGKNAVAKGTVCLCGTGGAVNLGDDWAAIQADYAKSGVPLILHDNKSLLERFLAIALH